MFILIDLEAVLSGTVSIEENKGLILYNILLILTAFLFYRNLDYGLRPLKIHEQGIEVPSPVASWKLPEMKRNNTFPSEFLPFSQIESIIIFFTGNGSLGQQIVLPRKNWENYGKITKIEMQPALAKEVIPVLTRTVGNGQLMDWFKEGKSAIEQFFQKFPEARKQALGSLRELLGEEMALEVVKGI